METSGWYGGDGRDEMGWMEGIGWDGWEGLDGQGGGDLQAWALAAAQVKKTRFWDPGEIPPLGIAPARTPNCCSKIEKASRGFEPRSLDSVSKVLTVTPRGLLNAIPKLKNQ